MEYCLMGLRINSSRRNFPETQTLQLFYPLTCLFLPQNSSSHLLIPTTKFHFLPTGDEASMQVCTNKQTNKQTKQKMLQLFYPPPCLF